MGLRPSSAWSRTALACRSAREASRRRRLIARLRAVVMIQPAGLGGDPSAGGGKERRKAAFGFIFASALMNSGFSDDVAWYPMGLFPPGAQNDHKYTLAASPDISADGTVRASELWVRRCY